MPRIPSVSDVRSVSAGVTRDPGVRATAEDFGLGISLGLRSMSGDLGRLSRVLKKRADEKALAEKIGQGDVDEGDKGRRPQKKDSEDSPEAEGASLALNVENLGAAQGKTTAAETVVRPAAHRVGLRDDSEALINEVADASAETAKRSHKELADLEERKLKALPPEQRAEAKASAADVHITHGLRLAERQQNLRGEAVIAKSEETLARLQAQAVQDPAAAEQRLAEGMETLTRLHEIGALTDAELAERSGRFTRELYTAVIQSRPAMDAVADLEAGLFDDVLGDPETKDKLLAANRWRLQSELEQGKAGVAETVERARRGEAGPGVLSAATRRILNAGSLADAELEIGAAEQAHAIAEERRFAPEAELRALLDDPEPVPGVIGERAQALTREELGLQVERLLEERGADPAAYVMGQPAVAEVFAAAEQDPTRLPDAIARRLAAQEALGIKPEDRRVLTKSEATELMQSLQALPLEQQAAAVAELRDTYGTHSGRLAAELEEAGLPRLLALVLDPSSDPALASQFVTLLNPQAGNSGAVFSEGGAMDRAVEEFIESTIEKIDPRTQSAGLEASTPVPRLIVHLEPGPERTLSGLPIGHAAPLDVLETGLSSDQRRQPLNHVLDLRGAKQDQMATLFKLFGVEDYPQGYELPAEVMDEAYSLLMRAFNIQDVLRQEGVVGLNAFQRDLGAFKVKLRRLDWSSTISYSPIAQSIDQVHKELAGTPLKHLRFLKNEELLQSFISLSDLEGKGPSPATRAALLALLVDGLAFAVRRLTPVGFGLSILATVLGLGQESREDMRRRVMNEMIERGLFPRIRNVDDFDFWQRKFNP